MNYNPVGVPDSSYDGFAFTGEQRDSNELQYHRARYYNPSIGVFTSLDPFEGLYNRPMSLNGYSWVEGNVINMIDPDGMQTCPADCELLRGNVPHSVYLAMCVDIVNELPDCVSLSPLSGQNEVKSNLIDTSLFSNWGVVFTVQCNTAEGIQWSETQKANIVSAMTAIDSRLQMPFRSVFGGLELRHVDVLLNPDGEEIGGRGTNPYLIRFGSAGRGGLNRVTRRAFGSGEPTGAYGLDVESDSGIQATVVHEIGHIFDYRTREPAVEENCSGSNAMCDWINKYNMSPTNARAGNPTLPIGTLWESGENSPAEKAADHFLNWVYNSYVDGIDPDNFPSGSVPDSARQIPAFWLGLEFNGVQSPGIAGWENQASKVAEPALSTFTTSLHNLGLI